MSGQGGLYPGEDLGMSGQGGIYPGEDLGMSGQGGIYPGENLIVVDRAMMYERQAIFNRDVGSLTLYNKQSTLVVFLESLDAGRTINPSRGTRRDSMGHDGLVGSCAGRLPGGFLYSGWRAGDDE